MKKFICLIYLLVLLGACKQNPNKGVSINHNIIDEQIDSIIVDSLLPKNTSDTVIYKYTSNYSQGDTTIGNYKMSCLIRPNGEFLPASYDVDSIAYVYENTEFLINAQYKDSVILTANLTRERFKELMGVPEEQFLKYTFLNVNNFNVDKDTFKMEVSLCIPDTDLFFSFELAIANNGDLSIKDVTPYDDEEEGIFLKRDVCK